MAQQPNVSDKYDGAIFTNPENDSKGRDNAGADLHSQDWKPIHWFAKFGWGLLKTPDDVAKRGKEQLSAPFGRGFPLKLLEQIAYCGRAAHLVLPSVVLRPHHPSCSLPGDLAVDPFHFDHDVFSRHPFVGFGELLQIGSRELSPYLIVERLEGLVLFGLRITPPFGFLLLHYLPSLLNDARVRLSLCRNRPGTATPTTVHSNDHRL
jgi:hypothetical protein